MDEKLLEIIEFKGLGYKPIIDYGAWRVAILRFIDDRLPMEIKQVERHNETDEVFVLLEGQAVLFMAEGDPEVAALYPQVLEPLKYYNVKRGAWHTIALSRDASILLVENRDTSTANSDYASLSPTLHQIVVETCAREMPEWWS
jgi:ureidoglycolate hydrolase